MKAVMLLFGFIDLGRPSLYILEYLVLPIGPDWPDIIRVRTLAAVQRLYFVFSNAIGPFTSLSITREDKSAQYLFRNVAIPDVGSCNVCDGGARSAINSRFTPGYP